MKRISCALLPLFWMSNAIAIVNIEDMRVGAPQPGFSGHLDLSASGKSGNTERQDAGLGSRLQWHRERHTDFLILSYDYGENSKARNTNKAFIHGRHVTRLNERYAWELFAQVENNEFARLSYRGLAGTGLRITLAEEENRIGLYLGIGAFYSRETLEETIGTTDHGSENFSRANIYLSYKHKVNDQVTLASTTYYQPRLDDGEDARALEQASMIIKMAEQLDFKVSVDVAHDSRPPQLVEKTDTTYSTGISWKF